MIVIASVQRVMIHRLAPQCVAGLLSGDAFVVCQGALPVGGKLVRAFYDADTDLFCLVVESDTYDPVPEGDLIPNAPPMQITRIAKEMEG